ncbi:MAG: hypothetical protein KatS3mg095_0037 [Candidatus Parcubacteria bacterium]|nr:MAG: hypothetical protein KatS3mg095_0037 [Candidatus Parcubacteria bacterium]
MEEIIRILNIILRLMQTVIILGSVGIIIYLGLLFYFKKFDEVKSKLPYVILGLVLLISVYSIPVIILSFLEKDYVAINNPNSNNSNNPMSSGQSFVCELIGDDGLVSDAAGVIFDRSDVSFTTSSSGCTLKFNINVKPYLAYVVCSYLPSIAASQECWGIYGSGFSRGYITNYNIISSWLTQNTQNIVSNTRRLARFPAQSKSIFCKEFSAQVEINNLLQKEGNYLLVIFAAMPTSSFPINIDSCINNPSLISTTTQVDNWVRVGWHILGVKVEKK